MHYSLTFEINSPKTNSEDSETATGTPESTTTSGLREMVTKALQEEASLPIDLETLNFDPGMMATLILFFKLKFTFHGGTVGCSSWWGGSDTVHCI